MMIVEHGMGSSDGDRELGLWIRQRRFERGLKQHVLAERAGLSRRWLVEVENGRLQPKFSDLLRLVEVLGADLMEAPGVRRSRPGADVRKLPAEEGEEARRREFVGWIVAAAGSAALVDIERLASPFVDADWLRDAESVSAGLAAQREAVEAGVLLPAVLGHLAALEAVLPASAKLTARTALLAGDLLLGYRAPIGTRTRQRLGEAYRCFILAESLGSPALVANAMNSRATLYDQRGDLSVAIALQDEALRRGATARANIACLHARRAELYAKDGRHAAAMRDLEHAEQALGRPHDWWCRPRSCGGPPSQPTEMQPSRSYDRMVRTAAGVAEPGVWRFGRTPNRARLGRRCHPLGPFSDRAARSPQASRRGADIGVRRPAEVQSGDRSSPRVDYECILAGLTFVG
jgi:HTH-type transcriptional regulator / antitoxin HipB